MTRGKHSNAFCCPTCFLLGETSRKFSGFAIRNIAYNYCYSTFLGRAMHWRGRDKMGFLDYKRQPRILDIMPFGAMLILSFSNSSILGCRL
jgi:hypothetical protein